MEARRRLGAVVVVSSEMVVIWSDVIVEKGVWLDLGYILNVEVMGLTNGFDVGLEEQSQGTVLDLFVLSNWMNGSTINRDWEDWKKRPLQMTCYSGDAY